MESAMILRRVIFWVGAVSLVLAPYIFGEQGASGKTVHHTGGCILEPRTEATANSKQWIELTDLEARIEATVNSKQWTE